MGLAGQFRTFCKNIHVQDRPTISNRYRKITNRLNEDFWETASYTSHSLYVGSYGRRTAIQGPSDIDMIFRLPLKLYEQYDNHTGNGQSALLQAVRKSLRKTFPSTKSGADGQVTKVGFSDGVTFEIVPAFESNGGSFTFPDTSCGGNWRVTDPRLEIAAFRTRNTCSNNNLVRLCRMMRAWKSMHRVPIGGLLVDTLAYQFINSWKHRGKTFSYYDCMCRDFFLFMAEQDKEQEYWKAPGSGRYVHKKGPFQSKAKRCYNIALEAIEYENSHSQKNVSAIQKWRDIFGRAFPRQ